MRFLFIHDSPNWLNSIFNLPLVKSVGYPLQIFEQIRTPKVFTVCCRKWVSAVKCHIRRSDAFNVLRATRERFATKSTFLPTKLKEFFRSLHSEATRLEIANASGKKQLRVLNCWITQVAYLDSKHDGFVRRGKNKWIRRTDLDRAVRYEAELNKIRFSLTNCTYTRRIKPSLPLQPLGDLPLTWQEVPMYSRDICLHEIDQ